MTSKQWQMWALHGRRSAGDYEFHYPHPNQSFPQAYATPDQQPVKVMVTEDPEGDYFGWLDNGRDYPTTVYGGEGLFEMCFPYGSHAEAEAGKGRVVKLRISLA